MATGGVALLGTWALVVNGTFFAALSIRTRNREIMLPLILFPISIPALLAMVDSTYINPYRRSFARFLDEDAAGLRCGLHPGLSAALRKCVERRMKRAFLAFIVLTVALLAFSTYQALFVAPTEQTMGDVQRIFYYHVPSAWTAGVCFFVNFLASVVYL